MFDKKNFILLSAFLLWPVFSCSQPEFITVYSNNIPAQASSNATLYNRELYISNIKQLYQQQKYREVVTTAENYYLLFKEDYSARIDYYLGRSIPHLLSNRKFCRQFKKMDYNSRQFYKIKRLKNNKGIITNLVYDNWHLQHIFSNHSDYAFERKVAAEVILPRFTAVSLRRQFKKNMKLLSFFKKYYPDTPGIYNAALNRFYFPLSFLQGKYKEKYSQYTNLFRICRLAVSNGAWRDIQGNFINVRNKNNYLHSRNIATLSTWEEIKLISTLSNRDTGKIWAKIFFKHNRSGFILASFIMSNSIDRFEREAVTLFRTACRNYYKNKFLKSAEDAAELVLSSYPQQLRERALVLLHKNHQAIASRATSRQNPYFSYVKEHPEYFILNRENMILAPSRLLYKYLLKINTNSRYKHYFI